MDQLAIDAFSDDVRHALFVFLGIDPSLIVSLGGFESFVFERIDTATIIRVTHSSHRARSDVQAELEWIDYLAKHGASVCRPVLLVGGALVVSWRDFHVTAFDKARGHLITPDDWSSDLFTAWGEAVGELHRLTPGFSRGESECRRIDWSVDPNFDFAVRIPATESRVMVHALRHREALERLPRTSDCFGLIHCDAHAGNFHYDGTHLQFFDFDDCCYCWFGYDIATVVFGAVLRGDIGLSDQDQKTAAVRFLKPFLDGYCTQMPVNKGLLEQLPLFLKIRELSLYGVIRTFLNGVDHNNEFVTRFMSGRQERLAQDQPFIAFDPSVL